MEFGPDVPSVEEKISALANELSELKGQFESLRTISALENEFSVLNGQFESL